MANINDLLRNYLRARLPLLMIVVIGLSCVLFSAVAVIPPWKLHEEAAADVAAGGTALAATSTAQSQSDAAVVLQRQIEGAQANLKKSGDSFLTQSQVDDLVHKVYDYADSSGAKIVDLQAQQSAAQDPQTGSDNPVLELRDFHLQVSGSVIQLMNFVILIREASTPGVSISGLNIGKNNSQYLLIFTLSMRMSPFASGNVFVSAPGQPTPVIIVLAPTITSPPQATRTFTPTALPTRTPTPPATAAGTQVAGGCAQQNVQTMRELHFSEIQQSTATCDIQVWNFKLDKQLKFVMDIVRRSGSGQYRMELHDANNNLVDATLSSIDGRGILVAESNPGNYTLNIIPMTATGTWVYDIAIWQGLPALSFSWAQNSFSSHTSIDAQSNVMTWTYTLTGAPQAYRIEFVRTDGNLEYSVSVLDGAGKEIATANSSGGNVIVQLTSGAGTYTVLVTTENGTSGSYRVALVH